MTERPDQPAAGPTDELRDCTWCGSARSIERGVCQVCLMWFPDEPAQAVPSELEEPEDEPIVVAREEGARHGAGPADRPAVGERRRAGA